MSDLWDDTTENIIDVDNEGEAIAIISDREINYQASVVFAGMNSLERLADVIIANLPGWDEEKINEAGRQAGMLEKQAFRVRGACAYELLTRIAPLKGGRGLKDLDGVGREAACRKIAYEFRSTTRTIRHDVNIFEKFGEDLKSSDSNAANVSREHLLIAATAPNPRAALEMAIEKGGDGMYNRDHFAADVRLLKGTKDKAPLSINVVENSRWVQYRVSTEAYEALHNIAMEQDKDPALVLNDMIIAVRKAQLEVRRNGTD